MNTAPVADESTSYDVIVIGSGPGGGTTAAKLAETGKRVLLLERGDYLPRERGNWDSKVVFGQGRYVADETFYDIDDNTFHPELHYFVGGNSKVYGAALFRLQPQRLRRRRASQGSRPGVAHQLRRPRALLRPGRAHVLGARTSR